MISSSLILQRLASRVRNGTTVTLFHLLTRDSVDYVITPCLILTVLSQHIGYASYRAFSSSPLDPSAGGLVTSLDEDNPNHDVDSEISISDINPKQLRRDWDIDLLSRQKPRVSLNVSQNDGFRKKVADAVSKDLEQFLTKNMELQPHLFEQSYFDVSAIDSTMAQLYRQKLEELKVGYTTRNLCFRLPCPNCNKPSHLHKHTGWFHCLSCHLSVDWLKFVSGLDKLRDVKYHR